MTQKELDKFRILVEDLAKEEDKSNKGSEDAKQVLRQIRDLLIAEGYNLKQMISMEHIERLEKVATTKVWELAQQGHKGAIKLIEQYQINKPLNK